MEPKLVNIAFTKTYATRESAIKAVNREFSGLFLETRYIIVPVADRFGVLFIGESAVRGLVFKHFNVVAWN